MRTATPVNFTLDLNVRSGPRSSQVARALIDAIARGQVHDGDRLPSTRTLAATFGLARTAVVAAYEELTAAGFLVARPGGSTYVERGAGAAARAGAFGAVPTGASGAGLPPPAPAAPRPARPITYDLRPGLADPGLISERDWTRAMRLAASPTLEAHQDLSDQLTAYLRRARGLAVDPEDIFLFPSVSNALRAVAVTCGLTGQPVAFEDPGYAKARLARPAGRRRAGLPPAVPVLRRPGPPVRAALRVLAAAGDHGPGRGRPDRPGHRRPDGDQLTGSDDRPAGVQGGAYRRRDRRVRGHPRRRPRVPVGVDDRQDPGPQPGRGLAGLGLARPRVSDLDRPLAFDECPSPARSWPRAASWCAAAPRPSGPASGTRRSGSARRPPRPR